MSLAYLANYLGAASGNVTVALTGQAMAFSAGTLTPLVSPPLSGQAFSFSQGTLTAVVGGDVSVALSGQSFTFSQGTLTPAIDTATSGQSTAFSQGSVAVLVSPGLTGQAALFSQGALGVIVTGDVTVALQGQSVAFSQGSIGALAQNPNAGGDDVPRHIAKKYQDRLKKQNEARRLEWQKKIDDEAELTREITSLLRGEKEEPEKVVELIKAAEPVKETEESYEFKPDDSFKSILDDIQKSIDHRKRLLQDDEELLLLL